MTERRPTTGQFPSDVRGTRVALDARTRFGSAFGPRDVSHLPGLFERDAAEADVLGGGWTNGQVALVVDVLVGSAAGRALIHRLMRERGYTWPASVEQPVGGDA